MLTTTVFRNNFPGFSCWVDLILIKFQNQFRDFSAQPGKIRTGVFVERQYAYNVAGWRLNSSYNDNNKFYVRIIDNFYIIVHTRRGWDGT